MTPELKEGILVGFIIGIAPALLRLLVDYVLDFFYPPFPRPHRPQKFDIHRYNTRLKKELDLIDKRSRILGDLVARRMVRRSDVAALKNQIVKTCNSGIDKTGIGIGEKN